MKKSAIYLGACAAILAIAGAFTTKAHSKVTNYTAWTKNGGSTRVTCSNQPAASPCKTALGSTLYTSQAGIQVAGHTLKTGS